MDTIHILLHNIRSAHNVGSLFRTADAAGVGHVYLTGYTPRPTDALGRVQKEIEKTALGGEKSVPWSYTKNPQSILKQLKRQQWEIVGIEQDARARDYRTFIVTRSTLFILGNEVLGISASLRSQCNSLIEIPMKGTKESLNVSVAGGIVLFRCIR